MHRPPRLYGVSSTVSIILCIGSQSADPLCSGVSTVPNWKIQRVAKTRKPKQARRERLVEFNNGQRRAGEKLSGDE